jgi:homoserine kinase type II
MIQQYQSTPELFEELSNILSSYPVGSLKEVEHIREGAMNDNWLVETDKGKYFLKRRNPVFNPDSIDFVLKLVEHILSKGFRTPRLIHTTGGALNVSAAGRYWELYEYISGDPFQVDNFVQIESAARLLARFHIISSGFQARAEGVPHRKIDLDGFAVMIGQLKNLVNVELKKNALASLLHPGIMNFIEAQAEIVINGIQPLSGNRLIVNHGDYQPSNIIFRGNEVAALVDFDNAVFSYRSLDMAKAILSFSSLKQDYENQNDVDPRLDWNRVKAFFDAYQMEMPLTEKEIVAIPPLIRGASLFGVAFYLSKNSSLASRVGLLIYALRFIRWFDESEAELREILLQESQVLRNGENIRNALKR